MNIPVNLTSAEKKSVIFWGIQYFTGITELDCSYNNIALLDLSKLPNITNVKKQITMILQI